MPLLNLSDRYLKRCHRDDNRNENQISLKKYRKKSYSESDDGNYERKKHKKSTRRDKDGRQKMIELNNRYKEREYRRSIKKEKSRSRDRYHQKSKKNLKKQEKSPKKSKSLKWEEELYGEKDKKFKYELLHSGKLSTEIDFNLEKLKNDTKSAKFYKKSIFDNQNNLIKQNNEIKNNKITFPKAFLDKNEINHFYNDLKLDKLIYDNLIKNDFDNNVNKSIDNYKNINSILNNENYLEKLNVQSLKNVTNDKKVMIVIDYEHSDKSVDAKIIYNKIINEENKSIENCTETKIFVTESVSKETSNIDVKSSSNDDIMALANLIVNAPQTINVSGNSVATIIKNEWKLIKLDIPIQIIYSARSIDISKCFKNDPRLERIRD